MTSIRLEDLQTANTEIANDEIHNRRFRCAIFDFDGTISLLREQWPQVMYEMMIEMITNNSKPTTEMQEVVQKYIQELAGISTIEQMRHLEKIVKEYRFSQNQKVLTAEECKAIYDRRLLKVVDEQLAMIEEGKVARQELLVPGVIDFLEVLKKLGLILYVASTTDRKYLLREAMRLGVDHYFRGIYAPDPGLPNFSKEWVVKQVLEWHQLVPDELLSIGDGPVEVSVAKKHGGFALGVASTEKPSGLINSEKRKMLLESGADMIIPDFSNWRFLIDYLLDTSSLDVSVITAAA